MQRRLFIVRRTPETVEFSRVYFLDFSERIGLDDFLSNALS